MSTARTRLGFGLILSAGLAAAVLLPATAASAHDDLASSTPAAGESLTVDPGVVTLDFSDELLSIGGTSDGFAVQVVSNTEGLHYESGCVALAGTQVTAPMALGDAGAYVVTWQVVSSDGHPTSGTYEFDYEPTSLDGAADGLTNAPVCGEAWAGEPDGAPTPTPSAPASEAATDAAAPVATATAGAGDSAVAATETAVPADSVSAGLPWWLIVLFVIAGLGVLAAVIVLVLRRNQDNGPGQS